MNYSDEVKLTIRDLNNLSKAFSSASNDFYGDKAMINTQLMLLKNNNFGLDSTDIIYNDISKVMKDFDSLVHKLKQMSSDLEVASKSYKDADNSFERKVNGVLYTSMNEVMDLGEDLWEKYKETPEKGAAFMGAAFNSAKDMTLGMFNLVIYGLYMKAHPLEYGKELYREACEVYKCFKNPKKGIDNLGSVGKNLLGINDKEMKNAAIHGDNYTIQKSTYLAAINATLMVDTGAGLLGKFGKVGKATEVEQNISKVSKLESVSNKINVFATEIPSIGDKLANFREFLANKLRGVTNEIPSPQLVRDSMGNTYMIWVKKVEGSGGEIVKSEKFVNGVGKTEDVVIKNDIVGKDRVGTGIKGEGSGAKIDFVKPIKAVDEKGRQYIVKEFPNTPQAHGFTDIVDNYAGDAAKFDLGKGATLYQVNGSLSGVEGRFEWITQNGNVTHRMFVTGGEMNGVPIK
ncbi:hypothetical protein [Clostridium felsineum]|uniref:hypothetical protein n=1 Tax=Clostridium felsineum TaxID=36839 RepID=UPI0009C6EF17|nr:hypothetical protein [Clostridium felsineum]URZ03169.1 hypothetical protein CLAUR_032150 [Clostridium felsineum]